MKIDNGVIRKVKNLDIINGKFIIPDSIIKIENSSFDDCSKLKFITIPNSVTEIGDSSFDDCESLESITVNDGNAYYSSENGIFFNKNKTTLIQYPQGKQDKKYTIPNSVIKIRDYAFYNCFNLESIIIPYSVTEIGDGAFYNSIGLTYIAIPNSVIKINDNAFAYCKSLESINIPNLVTEIEGYSFYNCTSLVSVTIPDSVTKIGSYAFYNCNNLKSITIPDLITEIGEYAFTNCKKLHSKTSKYKAFEKGLICNDMQYSLNEWNMIEGKIKTGEWGLHYVTNLFDIFNYYSGDLENDIEIWEVEVGDIVIDNEDDSKKATNKLKPIKRLNKKEIITILNNK